MTQNNRAGFPAQIAKLLASRQAVGLEGPDVAAVAAASEIAPANPSPETTQTSPPEDQPSSKEPSSKDRRSQTDHRPVSSSE